MFLTLLGGTLLLGAGLLAAANYTEGALVAARTAAQFIGWLLVGAALVGLLGLRRASWQKLGAAAVALSSGATLLYVSYFQWSEVSSIRMPLAATVASDWATYKFTPVLASDVVGTLAKTHATVAAARSRSLAVKAHHGDGCRCAGLWSMRAHPLAAWKRSSVGAATARTA